MRLHDKRRHTNNPERPAGEVDIEASEGRDTGALDLKDVIRALQRVWLLVEVEGKVGEIGNLCAVDGVLAVPRLLGTDLRVKHLRDIGGKGNQRGTWRRRS